MRRLAGQAARGARRAVALDMDGTTLTSALALTPGTVEAIRRVDAAGLRVIIATGRPALSVQPFINELALPFPVPVVCFNGALAMFLSAESSGPRRVLFAEALGAEAVARVLGLCDDRGWCASFCCPAGSFAAPRNKEQEDQLRTFEGLEGIQQERVPDLAALAAGGELPLKIVAFASDPEAYAAQAREALPSDLVHIIAAEMHVEFLNPAANKGRALVRLCRDELGFAPEDVVAFGDNHNDKEMLDAAGEGVAMGNAKESVKEVADRVCEWTNDEEGVARELAALLAGDAGADP